MTRVKEFVEFNFLIFFLFFNSAVIAWLLHTYNGEEIKKILTSCWKGEGNNCYSGSSRRSKKRGFIFTLLSWGVRQRSEQKKLKIHSIEQGWKQVKRDKVETSRMKWNLHVFVCMWTCLCSVYMYTYVHAFMWLHIWQFII